MQQDYLDKCLKWAIENNFKIFNPEEIKNENSPIEKINQKERLKEINLNDHQFKIASFSLYPSKIELKHFNRLSSLQSIFNQLIHKMTLDKNLFLNSIYHLSEVDPDFSGKLIEIHQNTTNKSPIRMAIHRTDYMFDTDKNQFLNIEINTFDCAFNGLASKITQMHTELSPSSPSPSSLASLRKPFEFHHETSKNQTDPPFKMETHPDFNIIPNDSLDKLVDFFNLVMMKFYSKLPNSNFDSNSSTKTILMIVKEDEINIHDHFLIINLLKSKHEINVIRATLNQVYHFASLDSQSSNLHFKNTFIGIVYFRSGSDPSHYPSNLEWSARKLIESSNAIKCPDIAIQIAGLKYFQYEWQNKKYLKNFLSPLEIDLLYQHFIEIKLVQDEISLMELFSHSQDYILKPQREGGGNNLHGDQIKKFLLNDGDFNSFLNNNDSNYSNYSNINSNFNDSSLDSHSNPSLNSLFSKLRGYICMKRIKAPIEENQFLYFSTKGLVMTNAISEVGIYGIWAIDQETKKIIKKIESIESIENIKNDNCETIENEIKNIETIEIDNQSIISNDSCGYLVKIKPANENEGGILMGVSCLNSLFLSS